jgi:signal transduction histidine kinase
MGRSGTIYITVSYVRENEILLVFKDDGLGMESEECAHIFDRHYQGGNGTSGSGMGLFLAKSSVTAHGGSISAKSEPGKGMGIYITLPV